MIYLDGSSTSLLSICSGDERYDELWVGDDKIWPEVTGAGGFVIQLPDAGTLDYQYWLHAVDASEDGNAGYMMFVVDGTCFYINSGPNGSEVVQLRGDVISLNERQREMLAGRLADKFIVTAEIQQRTKTVYSGSIYGGASRTDGSMLPVLPSTSFVYAQACARRGWDSTSYLTVTGRPGGDILLDAHVFKASRKWVEYRHSVTAAPESDTSWEAYSYIYNGGWMRNLRVQYPAFRRVFQLNVISFS